MNRTLPGSGGWTEWGDPTVTQIHFKRLALGRLTDRRWRRREPTLCHYAGRVRRTMWTRWWDGSPRFVLVRIHERDGETEKKRARACCCSPSKPLRTFTGSEIHNSDAKMSSYRRFIYNLMIWKWRTGSLIRADSSRFLPKQLQFIIITTKRLLKRHKKKKNTSQRKVCPVFVSSCAVMRSWRVCVCVWQFGITNED